MLRTKRAFSILFVRKRKIDKSKERHPKKIILVMSLSSFISAINEAGKREDREVIKQVLNQVKVRLVMLVTIIVNTYH